MSGERKDALEAAREIVSAEDDYKANKLTGAQFGLRIQRLMDAPTVAKIARALLSTDKAVGELRAEVRAIVDEQASAHRETVSPLNAFEHFCILNKKWVDLHARLRAALTASRASETGGDT